MLTCATILLTWSLFYEMAYYLPAWCDKGGNRERKLHMINGTEAGLYFSSERKLLEPLLNLPAILLFFCPKSSQSQATVAPLAYTLEWRRAWSHRWPSATCNPSEKYALSVESHWHWGLLPPEHNLVKADRCKAVSKMTPKNSKVAADHPHRTWHPESLSGLPTVSREAEFCLREKELERAK